MTIYICGDSTAASYTDNFAPFTGWGQVLAEYLPGVQVVNAAMAGRSSKSFLYEGRLIPVERDIGPGDLLLIQFTHNDTSPLVWRHTDAYTSMMNTLSIFADTASLKGAQPVLMTPICIRSFKDGALQPSHGEYPEAIRLLARQKHLPLIDLYRMSSEYVRSVGDEASRKIYMNLAPGEFPNFPDGREDDTHTQPAGAHVYARMAAEALRSLGLIREEKA